MKLPNFEKEMKTLNGRIKVLILIGILKKPILKRNFPNFENELKGCPKGMYKYTYVGRGKEVRKSVKRASIKERV